jgi:hypothetical protein
MYGVKWGAIGSDMSKGDVRKMAQLKVAALTQVDERSWDAINVEVAEVAGAIIDPYVHDVNTDQYHFILPVSIPWGENARVGASGMNTGVADQIMTLTVKLLDPDGIIRASASPTTTLAPGEVIYAETATVVLDKQGTWVIYALLEAELA